MKNFEIEHGGPGKTVGSVPQNTKRDETNTLRFRSCSEICHNFDYRKSERHFHYLSDTSLALAMVRSWNDSDNKKLADLFRKGPNRGGIDSTKYDKDTIHKVLSKHFGDEFEFKNFSPLFKRKCAKWNLDKNLTGR